MTVDNQHNTTQPQHTAQPDQAQTLRDLMTPSAASPARVLLLLGPRNAVPALRLAVHLALAMDRQEQRVLLFTDEFRQFQDSTTHGDPNRRASSTIEGRHIIDTLQPGPGRVQLGPIPLRHSIPHCLRYRWLKQLCDLEHQANAMILHADIALPLIEPGILELADQCLLATSARPDSLAAIFHTLANVDSTRHRTMKMGLLHIADTPALLDNHPDRYRSPILRIINTLIADHAPESRRLHEFRRSTNRWLRCRLVNAGRITRTQLLNDTDLIGLPGHNRQTNRQHSTGLNNTMAGPGSTINHNNPETSPHNRISPNAPQPVDANMPNSIRDHHATTGSAAETAAETATERGSNNHRHTQAATVDSLGSAIDPSQQYPARPITTPTASPAITSNHQPCGTGPATNRANDSLDTNHRADSPQHTQTEQPDPRQHDNLPQHQWYRAFVKQWNHEASLCRTSPGKQAGQSLKT